jgi:hypothetical protein
VLQDRFAADFYHRFREFGREFAHAGAAPGGEENRFFDPGHA